MGVSYALSQPGSWAVKSFGLRPTPDVYVHETVNAVVAGYPTPASTLTFSPFSSSGTGAGNPPGVGSGGEAAVGDLLVIVVAVNASHAPVSGPPGWTTLTPVVGLGTNDVLLATFCKIADAADLTSGATITFGTPTAAAATMHAIAAGSFDAGLLILAEAENHSTGDGPTAHSPPAFIAKNDQVIEFTGIASPGSVAPSVAVATGDPGTTWYFLNQQNDGVGGGAGAGELTQNLGWRWLEPFGAEDWHVGGPKSGAGWG